MTEAELMVVWKGLKGALFTAAREKLDGDNHDAEDAVQDTFLRVWRNRESLDPSRNVRGYINRVLDNVVKNRYRDAGRDPEEEWPTNEYGDQVELGQIPARDTERTLAVRRILADMTPAIRRTLLAARDGYTIREIMEQENISKSQTHRRIKKGRGKLKEALA